LLQAEKFGKSAIRREVVKEKKLRGVQSLTKGACFSGTTAAPAGWISP